MEKLESSTVIKMGFEHTYLLFLRNTWSVYTVRSLQCSQFQACGRVYGWILCTSTSTISCEGCTSRNEIVELQILLLE